MTHGIGIGAGLVRGALAGAAGTTALNVATYLDMAVRGRGASSAPEDTVEAIADSLGVEIPEDGDTEAHRASGLGALMGLATGVAVGAAVGATTAGRRPALPVVALAATLGAMAGSILPMAALGVSDPREWAVGDWVSDALPHAAYGLVTAWALDVMG